MLPANVSVTLCSTPAQTCTTDPFQRKFFSCKNVFRDIMTNPLRGFVRLRPRTKLSLFLPKHEARRCSCPLPSSWLSDHRNSPDHGSWLWKSLLGYNAFPRLVFCFQLPKEEIT